MLRLIYVVLTQIVPKTDFANRLFRDLLNEAKPWRKEA
jgi:hypothetical protein